RSIDQGDIRIGARLLSRRLDLAAGSEPAARRGASGLRPEPRRLRRAQGPNASGYHNRNAGRRGGAAAVLRGPPGSWLRGSSLTRSSPPVSTRAWSPPPSA